MKSSFFLGPGQITIGDMPDAEPGPGEILLDVAAVGICGSDLHNYLFGNIGGIVAPDPFVMGHEASGKVVAVGQGVDKEKFKRGQLVAIDPAIHCGECEFCEAGNPHLCARIKFMGVWPDPGAMRERMTHPARLCVPMPESISEVGAALLEPLGVALHGNRLADVRVGEDVLVIGCGGVGLLLIRLARLAGARHIFAVDRVAWRLDLASNYGADVVINSDKQNVLDEIARRTNKRGVDVAIEAAWVKDTANDCVEATRSGGRVVIVGIPAEDELSVRASTVRRKELSLVYSRRMKHTYPAAIALASSGEVDIESLATHRFSLDKTKAAFDLASSYQDNVIRAVIIPNQKS